MSRLLDLLFPPRCAACGTGAWPLCARCAAGVAVCTPPWCERCGRPTQEPLRSCTDCPPPGIAVARAPFVYSGPLARALKALKFGGWRALAPHLAAAMAEVCDVPVDVVTWVPLSPRRRARRGFDQAEVLAREVAGRMGLPAVRLLRRSRETPAQAPRPARERRRSVVDAFRAEGSARGVVLLVDDVLTTGATAAACASALRASGAHRVAVLTAARALAGPIPARCLGRPLEATGRRV